MVRQIGIEGDAVAGPEFVALAVHEQVDRTLLDDRGLARTRFVQRRVVGATGGGARCEDVGGDVGALARQRRGQLFDGVPLAPPRAAVPGADDDDVAALVQAQELREGEVEPGGDAAGDGQGRARLPRSTCESIGALTPLRSARSRSERPIASRSPRTRPPTAPSAAAFERLGEDVAVADAFTARTLSRTNVRDQRCWPVGLTRISFTFTRYGWVTA